MTAIYTRVVILLLLFLYFHLNECINMKDSQKWPVPINYYSNRTIVAIPDPYCKPRYKFCPTGTSSLPSFDKDDTIEVFYMKKPVWQFVVGNILGKYGIWHDAIGFTSQKTGKNYTNEWYELFELLNCTFPHIRTGATKPLWCNQGASCFYDGIIDRLWQDNGTIVKVTEISGAVFESWKEWMVLDNWTGPYYQTWRIKSGKGAGDTEWFIPFDCASFVIRSLQKIYFLGGKVDSNLRVNFTYTTLYSKMPIFLGNETDIFSSDGNKTIATTLLDFYEDFQAHHSSFDKWILSLIDVIKDFSLSKKFYIYYNKGYWELDLISPELDITYEYVPMPWNKE